MGLAFLFGYPPSEVLDQIVPAYRRLEVLGLVAPQIPSRWYVLRPTSQVAHYCIIQALPHHKGDGRRSGVRTSLLRGMRLEQVTTSEALFFGRHQSRRR